MCNLSYKPKKVLCKLTRIYKKFIFYKQFIQSDGKTLWNSGMA